MPPMKWRNEKQAQKALQAVTTAPPEALDEAIVHASYAGATFREIADAAGMTLNMTYRRARAYREKMA